MTEEDSILYALRHRLRRLRKQYEGIEINPAAFVAKFRDRQHLIRVNGADRGFYWIDEIKPKTLGNLDWSASLLKEITEREALARYWADRAKQRAYRVANRQQKPIAEAKIEPVRELKPKPVAKQRKQVKPRGLLSISEWVNELKSNQNH